MKVLTCHNNHVIAWRNLDRKHVPDGSPDHKRKMRLMLGYEFDEIKVEMVAAIQGFMVVDSSDGDFATAMLDVKVIKGTLPINRTRLYYEESLDHFDQVESLMAEFQFGEISPPVQRVLFVEEATTTINEDSSGSPSVNSPSRKRRKIEKRRPSSCGCVRMGAKARLIDRDKRSTFFIIVALGDISQYHCPKSDGFNVIKTHR
ncbi:hypothetical protein PHJA_002139600 [Phtheirospermum japonicum]|uniref:Uncharacterized protein n=1 Tax=Phtheirospermum japonicum TaxID=374723 RepID=A0A830CXZ5_9LAMI|nr:hypothetical protein PHJA_002139600 [Phtheirospermum japonicum]